MQKNALTLAIRGVDTAENGPSKAWVFSFLNDGGANFCSHQFPAKPASCIEVSLAFEVYLERLLQSLYDEEHFQQVCEKLSVAAKKVLPLLGASSSATYLAVRPSVTDEKPSERTHAKIL